MNLLSRSLVWRLVFSMFVLSVIATTIAAGLAYLRARDALSQSILERLTLAATLKENELKRIIGEKKTSMQFLASLPEFRMYASKLHGTSRTQMSRSRAALRKILAEPMVQDLGFREILILEAQSGLVLFSTDAAHQNDYRTLDRFFIEGSKGIFVHNVHPWPVTFQPTMTIALPLLTLHGDSIGVLAAHINLDLLNDILFEHSGLGMTGETYLVDRYNVFVSSKRFERKEYVRGVHTPGIDAAVRGTDSSGLYQNYAGVPIVGVFRWLDDFEIALIAEIHQSEAFEPARRLAMSVVSSGMLLAVALAIGIYLLSLQIVRPILAIKESAVRATEGDLSVMAPVEMQDEVGILARAFNAMIGNLRTTLASLRQELKERQVVEDALRQSEIRWQFALEGAGDGVWDWDVRTNRVFFSHRWKEM
ncbi:MAG: HAMP domain-containing protein, partial [Ignavibacteriales bacterium]|nr:HAMP domain-containing protein [Ignavibacteriales bacterium]